MRSLGILLAKGDGETALERVLPIGRGPSACFREASVGASCGRAVRVLGFRPTRKQLRVRSSFGPLRQRLPGLVHAVLLGQRVGFHDVERGIFRGYGESGVGGFFRSVRVS